MPVTAASLVADARTRVREIAPETFGSRDTACVLIDVREPMEFAAGHLPGSINIPRGMLEFQVDIHPAVANLAEPALSHRERPVVVYCRTGGRAALAADALQRLGFTDVRSIAGGIEACIAAGLPLSQH